MSILETEIELVRDYAFAFETRFNGHFSIAIDIPDKMSMYRMPPLTLQILVENAVKHNVVSREHPLRIQITTESDSKLVVHNNLQRKQVSSSPTHIGLDNILCAIQAYIRRDRRSYRN